MIVSVTPADLPDVRPLFLSCFTKTGSEASQPKTIESSSNIVESLKLPRKISRIQQSVNLRAGKGFKQRKGENVRVLTVTFLLQKKFCTITSALKV